MHVHVGYVCVRGFDRTSLTPKPLVAWLHLQTHKALNKGITMERNQV